MKKTLDKVIYSANRAGNVLFGTTIARKITSVVLAFTIALSPVVHSLTVMADETQEQPDIVEETSGVQTETEVTEAAVPSETTLPEYSESTTETFNAEDDDIIVVNPTETIDTTAPPSEQETEPTSETTPKVEQKKSNVVSANENNFADLIADIPSDNRLIVYYNGSLETEATGVYYDGIYYLSYSTEDAMFEDLCSFNAKGIPFATDGSAKVCGGLITYKAGVINPDAKTKIAVIDTGSDLANEKYSVIGDNLKDHNGHGTAMVNNILAQTDDAYVISIKAMADDGTGNVSDICAAVQLATDLKVDIIFMALSFKDSGDYDAFKKLVKEAQDQKITFIVSAGNNSAEAVKYLPAGLYGVITVGAILSDEGYKSPVSNYGSVVDYYEIANYTSDAASIFAGKYIAGNTADVATSCIMQGRPNEIGEDDPVVNAKRTLDRYNDTKGAYIYITAQQQRNMGYTCSDDFRNDIINAAKHLSVVNYGTYANNHGAEYEQSFLCLDYVHMVYGMIVIPTGHDNPGVGGKGSFTRHGRQTSTSAPRIANGHAWWWAYFSLNTDNDLGGKKYIGSPYFLYPYVQGTSVPYWTTNVVRPVDNISQNNCYDCSISCTDAAAMRALNMERGDLVFFGPVSSGNNGGGFGHAAIYSGTNGYFYDCGSTTSGNHYRADGAIVNGPGNYSRMMVYKIEDFDDTHKDYKLINNSIKQFETVDLIPSNISLSGTETTLFNCMSRESVLKRTIEPLRQNYDIILIDCMPSLGMMTINALVAADSVIIPCEPSFLSVKGLDLLLRSIAKIKRQINPSLQIDGVLMTMVDSRTINAREITGALREAVGLNINVFNTEIPRSVRATECPNVGKSIFGHDPDGKVAMAYKDLAKEVIGLERKAQVRPRPHGLR